MTTVVPGVFVNALAVDGSEGKLYWATGGGGSLSFHRADLDGSNAELMFSKSEVAPSFLGAPAFDLVNRKAYWSRNYQPQSVNCLPTPSGTMVRADLDGANQQGLPGGYPIYHISVEDARHYFATFTASPGCFANWAEVKWGSIDGGGSGVMSSCSGTDCGLGTVSVDVAGGKVYWVLHGIRNRANFDLSGVETNPFPVNHVITEPTTGKVYYFNGSTLFRANPDGTQTEAVLSEIPTTTNTKLAFLSPPAITGSVPPDRSVDARQPHDPHDVETQYGWNYVDIMTTHDPALWGAVTPIIYEIGGDGVPPAFAGLQQLNSTTTRINLASPIDPGAWTCFGLQIASGEVCVGPLPGDVNSDGLSWPSDILRLIDDLNGAIDPPLEIWQTDIDHSGNVTAADILRLIDILNGAENFEPWLGASLPELP